MSDAVKEWIETTIMESRDQWDYLSRQSLDDTFGWGERTAGLRDRMAQGFTLQKESAQGCGLLLTGPEGCGKHTAAGFMMQHLASWPGHRYQMIFLSGLTLAPLGMEAVRQRLEEFLTVCMNKKQEVCVQLEELEACPFRRELLAYWGQQLQNFKLSAGTGLFLILIDDDEKTVPNILRSQLMLCRMRLPTLAQRRAFLTAYAGALGRGVSLDVMAQNSQGASYAQLLDMITEVCWMVESYENGYIPNEDLARFLSGQMPEPSREDALQSLAASARQMVENLPRILSDLPAGTPKTIPQERQEKPTQVADKEAFMNQRRAEVENMHSQTLIQSTFSKKGLERLEEITKILEQ